MSLVNDLLVEIDGQHESFDHSRKPRLNGIAPNRTGRTNRVGFAPVALVVTAMMLFASAAILILSDPPVSGFGTRLPEVRPAVSARRIESAPVVRPTATSSLHRAQATVQTLSTTTLEPMLVETRTEQIALRPIAIQSLSISRDTQTTRLRIVADESAEYRIEWTDNPLEFEIILSSASLASPISDLKMLGTPIRSIRAHSDAHELRLALALDEEVRIQSQWIWQDYGAVLMIDLQDSDESRNRSTKKRGNDGWAQKTERSINRGAAAPKEAFAIDEQHPEDRTNATNTGQTLDIARSQRDGDRREQRALREQAHRMLEAARVARAQGKTQEAIGLYLSATQTLPGYREAILERAALLADSNQVREAVELIRDARRKSPNDPGMTMLHATIIAEVGDLRSAIQILDRSKHNITESPEVHALTAAFLQQKGDHALAIERYETILRRYPSEARWWMGLGISLEASQKTAEALDVYRIAVQLGELPSKARQWVSGRVTALGEEV